MDSQRLFLFIALALVLMLIWQAWEQEHLPQQVAGPVTSVPTETSDREVPKAPQTQIDTSVERKTLQPATADIDRGQRIHIITDLIDARIDTKGADLRALYLRKHPISADQPDKPFQLLSDESSNIFITQSGLIGNDRQYPNHKTQYKTAATTYTLAQGQNDLRVPFTWRAPDGVRYTKTFIFHRDSYVVDVEYHVENRSTKGWKGYYYGQFLRTAVERQSMLTTIPSYTGGAIYTPEEKYEKIGFDDMADKPLMRDVIGGWVAMMQHYFVASWMPKHDERNRFYSTALDHNRYAIGHQNLQATTVAPGKTGKLVTQIYVGPKEHKRLKKLAEGMELTVDFGWLTVISAPLFWLLVYIHDWVGNWGWAIVILTVLIKLAFFPLSAASYKSMANMRRLQPKLKSLKERYGQDRQRMNQAMMELYKTEKINPLGGCLPILIQIPVFIALYWVLLESVEMRHAPFALWLKDLSSPDPYYVLPILMGATMFFQQKLNPAPMDPIQQKVMTFLPLVFTIFFLFFPAGLVLYWVVNNMLSIAQQWQITRMIGNKAK